ncbi:hypothetical protein [Pasteurella atlantica]|uniref:hypothetical protein n=2 Tax=Pasteurella atlantica TaxID=2827233 RepID=UPI00275D5AD5|nr:hypothetical protein [Pasteurella atlantica]MDP8054780.1 hypothetical protein [Pasteurella atlantica]MDP8104038.1 hypothetical protein [Pasteurella atlantica]
MCYALFSAVSTVTELDKDGDGIADTTTEVITKPNGAVVTKVYTDSNDDGVQDSIVKTIKNAKPKGGVTTETGTITHNDDGTQTIKYEIDPYSLGHVSSARTDTIDAKGNVIKSEEDYTNNGVINRTVTYEYDESGKVTKSNYDYDNNGKPNLVIIHEAKDGGEYHYYDRDMNGTTETTYFYQNSDDTHIVKNTPVDNPDDFNLIREYSYNELGQNIKTILKTGDDKPIRTEYYKYNDKGHIIETKIDKGNDGSIDTIVHAEYDNDNKHHKLKELIDTDANGSTDIVKEYSYNERDLVSETRTDSDNDGTFEKVEYFTYNNLGNIVTYSRDDGNDHSIDYKQYREYAIAKNGEVEAGILSAVAIDWGNNGYERFDIYDDHTMQASDKYDIAGLENIYIKKDNLEVTISDDTLDKIANDNNGHKVIVNSLKSGDKLHLDGNFTKTTETESHAGQDYVKYTDEAGNALIVDPDITVDII